MSDSEEQVVPLKVLLHRVATAVVGRSQNRRRIVGEGKKVFQEPLHEIRSGARSQRGVDGEVLDRVGKEGLDLDLWARGRARMRGDVVVIAFVFVDGMQLDEDSITLSLATSVPKLEGKTLDGGTHCPWKDDLRLVIEDASFVAQSDGGGDHVGTDERRVIIQMAGDGAAGEVGAAKLAPEHAQTLVNDKAYVVELWS